MSETNDDEPQGPADASDDAPTHTEGEGEGEGEVDLDAIAAEDGDPEEDALDMSDLDALGVEGVVANLRSPEPDEADVTPPARPRRSPAISMLVVAFGAYLLVTMFGDFRYWTRSAEPTELGHAATLLQDGRTLDAYENQYVALEGTPDVQHATRLTTKERFIGYLRVTEGGGGLFAAVPRPKDQPATNNFEGRYVGRLRRLENDRAYQWLAEFYANEQITLSADLDPQGVPAALGSGSLPAAEGGSISVGPGEQLRLVFEGPDARVQLGRSSFDDAAAAEQAVAALGYPYIALPPTATFYRFVARIPSAERAAAQTTLNKGVEGGEESTDPKVGAFVLALPASYGAAAGDVRLEGDQLSFAYGDNTTSPGYELDGDTRLVERSRSEQLSMPVAQLSAVRLEQVIKVDPNGFVVAVGETPSEVWMMAMLWLLALAITGANVASLVLWWRRREA